MSSLEHIALQPVTYQPFTEANAPRAVAVVQGLRYQIVSYDITTNAHGATDTGTIALTASNTDDWSVLIGAGQVNPDQPIYASIYAGFPNQPPATSATDLSQLKLRFAGIVDLYSIAMKADRVTFSLRSLAAPMTSDKISIPFTNQTTVQFVQSMAARYGLSTNILLANQPLTIQKVLQDEFIAGTHNVVIWDLLLQCAIWDDVDVWVDRSGVLNYAAPYLVNRLPLDIQYGRDLEDLEITHAPQFSKNIKVEVRSYNKTIKQSTRYSTQNAFGGVVSTQGVSRTVVSSPVFGSNQTASTSFDEQGNSTTTLTTKTGGSVNSGLSGFASESGKENYLFFVPGLAPAEALDLSKKLWRQISMHEYVVTLSLPGTKAKFDSIDITALIRLHGTPYAKVNSSNAAYYKQLNNPASISSNPNNSVQGGYWPRSVKESFDTSSGLKWSIAAVNHTLPAGAV